MNQKQESGKRESEMPQTDEKILLRDDNAGIHAIDNVGKATLDYVVAPSVISSLILAHNT